MVVPMVPYRNIRKCCHWYWAMRQNEAKKNQIAPVPVKPKSAALNALKHIETLGAWQLLGYSPWNLEAILKSENLSAWHILKSQGRVAQPLSASAKVPIRASGSCYALHEGLVGPPHVSLWTFGRHESSRIVTISHPYRPYRPYPIGHAVEHVEENVHRNDTSNVCIRPSSVSKSRASSLAMHCSKSASACHAKNIEKCFMSSLKEMLTEYTKPI